MITPGSSIPEILRILSPSFSKSVLNEVQEILLGREKMMKMELEDLRRDVDSVKIEARLQERSHAVAEREKLRMEEELQKVRRTCEELNEKIARLSEEHKVCGDRAKRAEERHEALSKEFSEMLSKKNNLIVELKGKIKGLQTKNLENEQLVGKYEEESKSLRAEKLASDQLVVELRRKQSETIQSLDELRHEKMECDKKIENLTPRLVAVETDMANFLNVKVEDLASLTDFMDKFYPNAKRADLPDIIKCWKLTRADAEYVGTCNSTASDTPSIMKDYHDSVTPQHPSCAATEVIQIGDSDDEAKPSDTSDISSGQQKRKRTLEKGKTSQARWYSSSDSD